MPLIHGKSQRSFDKNIATEMHAGKPMKQSLAIAYATKRKAEEEDKKKAHGGMMSHEDSYADGGLVDRIMKARCYSEGGMVANDVSPEAPFEPNEFDDLVLRDDLEADYVHPNDGPGNAQEDEDRRDIVSRIMKSRRLSDRNPRPA